jgi:hypothetical protein
MTVTLNPIATKKHAESIAGTLGKPSKMPGLSYGLPAQACRTGSKLATVPGSVCAGCYALKGNYVYPSVQTAQARRLEAIDHPQWTEAMVYLLRRDVLGEHGGKALPPDQWYFRWHDSGDLQSADHLAKICAVAALTPEIRHWMPTREHGIVRYYLRRGGTVPGNLVIRISTTMVDGAATTQWPTTSTVSGNARPDGARVCPAPQQDNKCGACRACWMPAVRHVDYHVH